jgi:F-type H+-transporting ATPase subunit epsilon
MSILKLKIITPKKLVKEDEAVSITVPTASGEITILPHHVNLFSLMVEGIVKIKHKDKEEYLSVGGGYIETDGDKVVILVSRAYGQDQIDENMITKAVDDAKKILKSSLDEKEKMEAMATLRRAVVDSKLLKRKKHRAV